MEWKKNARARKNLPSCERSGHATMDNKTARKIIFELANSNINENELAQKYGINSQVVSQIATGKTWRELLSHTSMIFLNTIGTGKPKGR